MRRTQLRSVVSTTAPVSVVLLHCADHFTLFEVNGCGGSILVFVAVHRSLSVCCTSAESSQLYMFLLRVMLCMMLEAVDCVHLN